MKGKLWEIYIFRITSVLELEFYLIDCVLSAVFRPSTTVCPPCSSSSSSARRVFLWEEENNAPQFLICKIWYALSFEHCPFGYYYKGVTVSEIINIFYKENWK